MADTGEEIDVVQVVAGMRLIQLYHWVLEHGAKGFVEEHVPEKFLAGTNLKTALRIFMLVGCEVYQDRDRSDTPRYYVLSKTRLG